jgi:hypothetical protein
MKPNVCKLGSNDDIKQQPSSIKTTRQPTHVKTKDKWWKNMDVLT